MKTLTTCTLLVLVLAAAPAFLPRGQVAAESDTPELELERANTITVTGRSDLIVSADRATLSVDVRSESPSLGDARADYHRRVETLLRHARKLGVPTRNMRVETYGYSWWHRRKGVYHVGRRVVIEVEKLDRLEDLYMAGWEVGGENIGVIFDSSRRHELRLQAYEDAVQAARRKAEKMTKALGQHVGLAIRVTEDPASQGHWWNQSFATNSARNVGGHSMEMEKLASGKINVQAYVEVVFTLV